MAQNPLRRPSKGAPMTYQIDPKFEFPLQSRSRGESRCYVMIRTPDGYAVHQLEGCEGERFHGPLGCYHSKENSPAMTTAVQAYQGGGALIERQTFTEQQIQVLKNTICRGASDAELQMFTHVCEETGLDPFLKQIWAIQRNVKVAQNPDRYESQMTIQIGIDGYRVMRDRIKDERGVPLFEGMEGPQWSDDGREWFDFAEPRPGYARVAVWRKGIPRPFVAVCRMDAYDQKSGLWRTMAAEQLAKCAEALALRRAFPAEMSRLSSVGGEVAAEDLDDEIGAAIDGEVREIPSAFAPAPPPEPKPEPAAPAQPRQTAQKPRNAAATPNTPPATPQTPPALPESPTQPSGDPRWLVPHILSEIFQSQGREQYVKVGKDLLATFPAAKHPAKAMLRDLAEVDDATVAAMLARLNVWQRGEDPNANRPQESDNSAAEPEATAECVNCHVVQVVDLETLTDDAPCSACGGPIGVEIVPDEAFQ